MKINIKEVDKLLEMDIEWIWWQKDFDLSKTEFKFISDLIVSQNPDIKYSDIFIHWHAVVGEYCIYIKNKWSGYVEDWHFSGYSSYDECYNKGDYYKVIEAQTKPLEDNELETLFSNFSLK